MKLFAKIFTVGALLTTSYLAQASASLDEILDDGKLVSKQRVYFRASEKDAMAAVKKARATTKSAQRMAILGVGAATPLALFGLNQRLLLSTVKSYIHKTLGAVDSLLTAEVPFGGIAAGAFSDFSSSMSFGDGIWYETGSAGAYEGAIFDIDLTVSLAAPCSSDASRYQAALTALVGKARTRFEKYYQLHLETCACETEISASLRAFAEKHLDILRQGRNGGLAANLVTHELITDTLTVMDEILDLHREQPLGSSKLSKKEKADFEAFRRDYFDFAAGATNGLNIQVTTHNPRW